MSPVPVPPTDTLLKWTTRLSINVIAVDVEMKHYYTFPGAPTKDADSCLISQLKPLLPGWNDLIVTPRSYLPYAHTSGSKVEYL